MDVFLRLRLEDGCGDRHLLRTIGDSTGGEDMAEAWEGGGDVADLG